MSNFKGEQSNKKNPVCLKGIWFPCWAFGAILGTITLLLAILDNEYWIVVSIFFWILHIIGIVKTNYDPLGRFDDPKVKSSIRRR